MPTTTGPRTSIKNRNISPTQPFTNWIKGEGFLKHFRPLKPSGKIYLISPCQIKTNQRETTFITGLCLNLKRMEAPAPPHPNRPKKAKVAHFFKILACWSLYFIFFSCTENLYMTSIYYQILHINHWPKLTLHVFLSFLSVPCSGIRPPPLKNPSPLLMCTYTVKRIPMSRFSSSSFLGNEIFGFHFEVYPI